MAWLSCCYFFSRNGNSVKTKNSIALARAHIACTMVVFGPGPSTLGYPELSSKNPYFWRNRQHGLVDEVK
jgi:hypothetical protein